MALSGMIAAGSLIAPVTAQKGPRPTVTELRTIFRDAADDAVRSDGGDYQTDKTEKTSNTLTATEGANYMLETFTGNKGAAMRCLSVDPVHIVAQRPEIALPAFGCVDVRITSHSYFFDSTDSLRTMDTVENSVAVKRLGIGWIEGDFEYYLRFKGEIVDVGDGSGAHRLANVGFTCAATTAVGCTDWTAEPIRCDVEATGGAYSSLSNCDPADGRSNSLAVLERRSTRPNPTVETLAVVDMPFVAYIERRN
jgi:hypothetical protein